MEKLVYQNRKHPSIIKASIDFVLQNQLLFEQTFAMKFIDQSITQWPKLALLN